MQMAAAAHSGPGGAGGDHLAGVVVVCVLGTWLRCNSIIFICSDEVQNYTRISVVCSLSSNPVSELSGAYWFVR